MDKKVHFTFGMLCCKGGAQQGGKMKLDLLGVLEIYFTFGRHSRNACARVERDDKVQHVIKGAAGVGDGEVASDLAMIGVIVGNYDLLFAVRSHTLIVSNLRASQNPACLRCDRENLALGASAAAKCAHLRAAAHTQRSSRPQSIGVGLNIVVIVGP